MNANVQTKRIHILCGTTIKLGMNDDIRLIMV